MSAIDRLRALSLPWIFQRQTDKHLLCLERGGAPRATLLLGTLTTRILATFPPGRVKLLFIDPIGLGQNFAAFSALGDDDPEVISGGICSEARDIRKQLELVVRSIGAIVQGLLRDEYATLDDYNLAFAHRAGAADQPYRFIVVAGFPEGFDSESCNYLAKILKSGARCGVHVLMAWNRDSKLPHGVEAASVLDSVAAIDFDVPDFAIRQPTARDLAPAATALVDREAEAGIQTRIVRAHAAAIGKAKSVEYPIARMIEAVYGGRSGVEGFAGRWTGNSGEALAIPLGQAGANRTEALRFGRDGATTHHAVVLGGTGSGKSNLLHVMIQSLSELYPPDELSLYLVDGKNGVEFKPYADERLPHARLVALDSDPAFGRSILEDLTAEMDRRNSLFKDHGVDRLAKYRAAVDKPMPRIVAIFDEFQEMLRGDRRSVAAVQGDLEHLARAGRSAGIHLVLATQTLRGVDLPEALLSQVGVRVILKNAEDDWPKVLANDNKGPSTLQRGGQAIVNTEFGQTRGNKEVQIARAATEGELRYRLRELRGRPITAARDLHVFDGGSVAPLEGSPELARLIAAPLASATRSRRPAALRLLVGEPIAMRATHALALHRVSAANVLILDRDSAHAAATLVAMLVSALAQHAPATLQIDLFDFGEPTLEDDDPSPFDALAEAFNGMLRLHGPADLATMFAGNKDALENARDAPALRRLVILFGLHRARSLWRDAPRQTVGEPLPPILEELLQRGPESGIHIIIWCDSFANLQKALSGGLDTLGLGVAGRLDSAASLRLIDSQAAAELGAESRRIAFDRGSGASQEIRRFDEARPAWLALAIEAIKRKHEGAVR